MSEFINNLKHFDCFSSPIRLNYRKHPKYKTSLGGCCSIILILITIFDVYYFFNIYTDDNTYTTKHIQYSSSPKKIRVYTDTAGNNSEGVDRGKLIVSFGLYDTKLNGLINIDESIFDIQMFFIEQSFKLNKISITKNKIIPLFNCTKFGTLNNSSFIDLELYKTKCFNLNEVIKGNMGLENSSYLKVSLIYCNKEPKSLTCNNSIELNSIINNISFEIFYFTQSVDLFNYTNTVSNDFANDFYPLVPGLIKTGEVYLSTNRIYSYDSFLYNLMKSSRYDMLEILTMDDKLRALTKEYPNLLFELFFFTSNEFNYYERSYNTIFHILAIIGGHILGLITVLGFTIYYFIKHKFEENIVNDLYLIVHPKNEKYLNKSFSVFLKERYLNLVKIEDDSHDYDDIKKLVKQETTLDKFFDKSRMSTILGLESNQNFFSSSKKPETTNNNSANTIKNMMSATRENVIDNISNSSLKSKYKNNLKDNLIINEDILDNSSEKPISCSFLFPNLNNEEYYKYNLIYDLFKYETNDKMFYSIFEILKEVCFPCFAGKINRKKFDLYRFTLKKLGLDLDFLNLINALNQYEALKNIYFDKQQKKLFDTIVRTKIDLNIASEEEKSKEMELQKKKKILKNNDHYDEITRPANFEFNFFKSNELKDEIKKNENALRLKRLYNKNRSSLMVSDAKKKLHHFDRNNKMKLDLQKMIDLENIINESFYKPMNERSHLLLLMTGLDLEIINSYNLALEKKFNIKKKIWIKNQKNNSNNDSINPRNLYNSIMDKFSEKDSSFSN